MFYKLNKISQFLERITGFVDRRYPVDVLYLDFSKAFDKMPHRRLILKVKQHGIGKKKKVAELKTGLRTENKEE